MTQKYVQADEDVTQEQQESFLDQMHPADAADHLGNLSLEDQVLAVGNLPVDDAAQSIAEMDSHDRIPLMTQLPPRLAADILALMSPDDAADMIAELDPDVRRDIFRKIKQEDAAEIKALLMYDPDSAGGVMNTEILVLDENLTADQAIALIRQQVEDSEIPYYAYMVDGMRHLKGVLSLRDIMISVGGGVLKNCWWNRALSPCPLIRTRKKSPNLLPGTIFWLCR